MRQEIIQFLNKEFSLDALRNIILISVSSFLLYFLFDLHIAIPFAVGILLASLVDLPGNRYDKWTTAKWCISIFTITAFSISYSLANHTPIILLLLFVFGFLYTMLSVINLRIGIIGNLGLIVASFTIGLRPIDPLIYSISFVSGTIFFFFVSIIQSYISPYRSLKFALQDNINLIAQLIKLKINCYNENISLGETYKQLSILHIRLSDQLEHTRALLLKEKDLIKNKSINSEIWLSKLYALIDLYELLTAIDHDYETIRKILKDTNTLPLIRTALNILAEETAFLKTNKNSYLKLRRREELSAVISQIEQSKLNQNTETFLLITSVSSHLKQISDILSQIESGIIHQNVSWIQKKHFANFIAPKFNFKKFISQFTLKSSISIYAIRMALLLLLAGTIGFLYTEFRYASWILLTIILVAKPTFQLTQKRNKERIIGSVIGIILSLIIINITDNFIVLIIISLITLYLYQLFNKPNYLVCVIFITISIVVFQYIIEDDTSFNILSSRFLFTLLGSFIAIIGALALPINHLFSVEKSTDLLIQSFREYLNKIIENIESNTINFYDLRLQRKFTQTSLANCYDNLNQLENEPRIGKHYKEDILQFQSTAYRINALLVGLAINISKAQDDKNQRIDDKIEVIKQLINESNLLSKQILKHKQIS